MKTIKPWIINKNIEDFCIIFTFSMMTSVSTSLIIVAFYRTGIYFFIFMPIMLSIFMTIYSLCALKDKDFITVDNFWLMFIPGINLIVSILMIFCLLYNSFAKLFNDLAITYKEQSELEVVNMLEDILRSSKKFNNHLCELKKSSNAKADKLTVLIIETNQEMLRLIKG